MAEESKPHEKLITSDSRSPDVHEHIDAGDDDEDKGYDYLKSLNYSVFSKPSFLKKKK